MFINSLAYFKSTTNLLDCSKIINYVKNTLQTIGFKKSQIAQIFITLFYLSWILDKVFTYYNNKWYKIWSYPQGSRLYFVPGWCQLGIQCHKKKQTTYKFIKYFLCKRNQIGIESQWVEVKGLFDNFLPQHYILVCSSCFLFLESLIL